jgi:hypothetical protein
VTEHKVLLVAPYARWLPHWETDLEIAQRHLDGGDRVTLMVCNADLATCDPNPEHGYVGCAHCIGRQREGLRLLDGAFSIKRMAPSGTLRARDLRIPAVPDSLDELRSTWVENFDLGWASLSSLVSWTGDPEPNIKQAKIKKFLERAFVAGMAAYQGLRAELRAERYDLVYVFNGRSAITRAVVRACEAESVPFRTHDRGCDFGHFELFENRLPHDFQGTLEAIRTAWQGAVEPMRSQLGEKFFQERRLGVKQSWISYTGRQEPGRLPKGWDNTKSNIVVFVSSEDELVAIGEEWSNPIYRSQADGLKQILHALAGDGRYHFYIRMHPNQAGNKSAAVRELYSLSAENVTVVPPDSPVCSYALLDRAEKVLSFGSTVGIEAAFWGRVSIVAGRSAFEGLGSTYEPSTHDEVVRLIVDTTLHSLPRAGALAYGYYEQTRGQRFQYFEGTDVWEGKFKGHRITGGPGFSALIKAKRLLPMLRG